MKKKITNEKKEVDYETIREFFKRRSQYLFDRAQIRMWIAETNLVESLNPEQMELYEIYKERKKEFFDSASLCYVKIFQ